MSTDASRIWGCLRCRFWAYHTVVPISVFAGQKWWSLQGMCHQTWLNRWCHPKAKYIVPIKLNNVQLDRRVGVFERFLLQSLVWVPPKMTSYPLISFYNILYPCSFRLSKHFTLFLCIRTAQKHISSLLKIGTWAALHVSNAESENISNSTWNPDYPQGGVDLDVD